METEAKEKRERQRERDSERDRGRETARETETETETEGETHGSYDRGTPVLDQVDAHRRFETQPLCDAWVRDCFGPEQRRAPVRRVDLVKYL